ncbi:MAG: type II toxin-antitoxin system VapC family toxin [Gemmatimonas sp.]
MIVSGQQAPTTLRKSILVDTNVLLDVFTDDPMWFDWSSAALAMAANTAQLVISPIIYAEVSVRFASVEELEQGLPAESFQREHLPWEAAFLVGKAFLEYRNRGGLRRSPMPDFYIGAHALVRGHTLLTRDASRYRTYFPQLKVVSPE